MERGGDRLRPERGPLREPAPAPGGGEGGLGGDRLRPPDGGLGAGPGAHLPEAEGAGRRLRVEREGPAAAAVRPARVGRVGHRAGKVVTQQ